MNEPLVSIIIPVYNGANYMREAIDSALAQTYKNIEVMVVNDGSSDNGETERIALSYGDRIRYLYKINGGVATALNYAIEEMKGEYFSWLSHDDLYYPQKIEKQVAALKSSGDERSIVLSDVDFMEQGKISSRLKLNSKYAVERLQNSVFPVLEGMVNGCALLIHKSHFDRVGHFDENLITTQDYDLWFRMFRNQSLIYVPEALIISRLHDAQGSRTISQHESERDALYIRFMEQLTEHEMIGMYGSPYRFYGKMNELFLDFKLHAAYLYSDEKMRCVEVDTSIFDEINELKHYLKHISNSLADRICVFGAGAYGRNLKEMLQNRNIPIGCFCDNDAEKWGTIIEGVVCVSPSQLMEIRDRTLVIVAIATPEPIVRQLQSLGIPFIITKQELDPMLNKTSSLKWSSALHDKEDLNYTAL
ncbi:glycosyltransferase [Paenibacillus glycinis]|uniref:Glycosyltransferase n=1 Tax=Paenibacillus glycinis TaxID=2697035 RepID=A0ABW9XVI8_9BACL|nr:glycosyltransferase [Paenibacillus glycinis]NBD26700.1 glycosyltransferase [Paenibacillus glycinis]